MSVSRVAHHACLTSYLTTDASWVLAAAHRHTSQRLHCGIKRFKFQDNFYQVAETQEKLGHGQTNSVLSRSLQKKFSNSPCRNDWRNLQGHQLGARFSYRPITLAALRSKVELPTEIA